jgi:hypothetical protein
MFSRALPTVGHESIRVGGGPHRHTGCRRLISESSIDGALCDAKNSSTGECVYKTWAGPNTDASERGNIFSHVQSVIAWQFP